MSFKTFTDKIFESDFWKDIKDISFRDVITGTVFTKTFLKKQYPLLILIVILTIVYTDNRYASEKQITRINELKKQVKDAKYESLTISANLMEISRQSNISALLEAKGIKLMPGTTPPIVIK
jgi:hypothetical protein